MATGMAASCFGNQTKTTGQLLLNEPSLPPGMHSQLDTLREFRLIMTFNLLPAKSISWIKNLQNPRIFANHRGYASAKRKSL